MTLAITRAIGRARVAYALSLRCNPSCPGWGHFDEGTDREGIQRCDECKLYADDDAAAAAHARECKCGMGVAPTIAELDRPCTSSAPDEDSACTHARTHPCAAGEPGCVHCDDCGVCWAFAV